MTTTETVEVTDEAREAAWQHRGPAYRASARESWMAGVYDEAAPIIRTFARVIAAAEKRQRERDAQIARDYASKARNRGWTTAPDSAAKAGDHIAQAIRTQEQDHG